MTLLSNLHILPKADSNFKAKTHFGSFENKLDKLIRTGGYHGLDKVKDDVVGVMKKYEGKIRTGGINGLHAHRAYHDVVNKTPNLSGVDKTRLKNIIEYYTKGNGASKKLAEAQRRIGEAKIERYLESEAMDKTTKAVSVSQLTQKRNQITGTISSFRNGGQDMSPSTPSVGSGFRPIIPLSK